MPSFWKIVTYTALGVGIVAAVAVPAIIAGVGFTTAGVAAASAAAAAQAAIGNVAAGSFFAFMQSIGTMPLMVSAVSFLAGVLSVVLPACVVRFFSRQRRARCSAY